MNSSFFREYFLQHQNAYHYLEYFFLLSIFSALLYHLLGPKRQVGTRAPVWRTTDKNYCHVKFRKKKKKMASGQPKGTPRKIFGRDRICPVFSLKIQQVMRLYLRFVLLLYKLNTRERVGKINYDYYAKFDFGLFVCMCHTYKDKKIMCTKKKIFRTSSFRHTC